ncbi:2-keto-4-pentenoate hydratase [Brevundimonas faecalis]|uniref:2-oxo-3-hexenedioate decarboxylase n=1 Tax=Brevundimonas faecalis TaxID=947378 RepID=A0ABV2RFH4_9CAUL
MVDIADIAARLDAAARDARAIPQITGQEGELALNDAYDIQRAVIDHRLARGATLVGVKMGFTSEAKMVQMGLKDQIWGRLTSDMVVADGGVLDRTRFIHPRVEPEVAVRLKAPLTGTVNYDGALAAVDAVAPALEVIDSRYENFRFALGDVVADNASSSAFVVGPWLPAETDLADVAMEMSVDGTVVERGSSDAILGDPIRSLIAAARLAGAGGLTLQPGWTVMLGGATAAAAIGSARLVSLDAGRLGRVGFTIAGGAA